MGVAVRAGTAVVAAASRVRGARAIHARGRTLSGHLEVTGGAGTGAALFDEPASYDVVLRLSRSAGLPEALPDVLGFALRVLDAHGEGRHQDLLLDSARPEPLLRRWPCPVYDHLGATHSSLLAFDVAGRSLLVGARGLAGTATSLRDLEVASWALLVATPHGPWQQVGTVRTAGVLPAPQGTALRFNPANTGGGIRPSGWLQPWRISAYPVSQEIG